MANKPAVDPSKDDAIEQLLQESPSFWSTAKETLDELKFRLESGYEFRHFPKKSVNYGLMLTYRQEWTPLQYQVGRLLDTIPLTPGERREIKITTTRKIHEARSTFTHDTRESTREDTSLNRLEAEAVEAATMALNNQFGATGNFNIGVGSIGAMSDVKTNLGQESRRTRKNFSELTRKAVDSLKNQVEIKVESTSELSTEQSDLRTITNPNNEITVTYLLYELERLYRVETQLSRIRPVIMVALDMPGPTEITAAWVLQHGYIIRKVLLDQSLLPVLDELEELQSSAALDHEIARKALQEQRDLHKQLVEESKRLEADAARVQQEIGAAAVDQAGAEAGKAGFAERAGVDIFTGFLPELVGAWDSRDAAVAGATKDVKQLELQATNRRLDDQRAAVAASVASLGRAFEDFRTAALKAARSELASTRLSVHIRNNIFHYLHAIWSETYPDNRYFELYNWQVPFHTPDPNAYALQPPASAYPIKDLPGLNLVGDDVDLVVGPPEEDVLKLDTRQLSEIADIDRPLGFRGNFIVFELRECSQLTDYMAAEYIDPLTGVADAGTTTGITARELIDYLRVAVERGYVDKDALADLRDLVRRIDHQQHDWADDVVLPTGQVVLEAIKGGTTLLEPFKLVHRGLDVLSAEEDVRAKRLDSLRRARKVIQSDLERDPTSVERFYLGEDFDRVDDGAPQPPPP